MKQSIPAKSETKITVVFNRGVDIITDKGNRGSVESMTYKAFWLRDLQQFEFTATTFEDIKQKRIKQLEKKGWKVTPANEYGHRFNAVKEV